MMRSEHRWKICLYTMVALLALPAPSTAATAVKCGNYDCTEIQDNIVSKESFTVDPGDMQPYINRGWSTPGMGKSPGNWMPDEGKGAGITTGGAGGFSYGTVKAPESPPGARNENASVSGSSITSACNLPPRIKLGLPPTISMPAGTCLDFMSDLFKDKGGNTSSATPPAGVDPSDTCPVESNDASLYGVKQPASGTIPFACGGMVPTATADLTLNPNPTELATTTAGSYYLWTYRKSGANFAPRLSAVKLPTFICEAVDSRGHAVKTTDLPPPTEQMVTYNRAAGFLVLRLQSRSTMPSTFIPPYNAGDPEKYLILRLNASGDPMIPKDPKVDGDKCAPVKDSSYGVIYGTVSTNQAILIQSARGPSSECNSMPPTVVNFPRCFPGDTAPGCGILKTLKDQWIPVCNPSNPAPPYLAKILPVGGICPMDTSGGSCTASPPAADANCDIVSMPVPSSAGPACADQVQYMALDRPSLYFPAGSSATFSTITSRTQLMTATTDVTRYYMQSNTIVRLQSSAPTMNLVEGGTVIKSTGDTLIMNAPATVIPGSGSATLTNGGQLVSKGGTQLAIYPAGSSVPMGSAPFEVHVGRSISLPNGFLIPTVPTIGSQPPYAQLPIAPPTP